MVDGYDLYGMNDDRAYLFNNMISGIEDVGMDTFLEVVGSAVQNYSYDLERKLRKKLEKEIADAYQAKADAEKMVNDMQAVLNGMKK